MRILEKTVTAFLLFFFLFTSPSTADIKSIKIRSDKRPMILFEKFGFTHTGFITVAVSNVSVNSKPNDPSRQGFFLVSEESVIHVLHELQLQDPDFCVLDSKYISLLFTFRDLSPPPHSSFNLYHPYPVLNPNEYSLFFANCHPESLVTMDVRIELFNKQGATKNYLSIGLRQLPSLYFIFSIVYLCVLAVWIYLCFHNQQSVHQIHLLMAALLIMKAFSLFCASEDAHHVKVTGTPHGWNVLFYIFQFINSILSFTVIVLIGSGWPYLKPLLLQKEKNVLMIVIPLQVLANLVSIVIGETGPYYKDWVTWNQVCLLADFICCCAVLFPVWWSIRSLSRTNARGVKNLKVFWVFFVAVIGYLLFTRIGVFALKIIVVYKDQWVCSAVDEIARIVFYLVMFYMFRPLEEFVLHNEGEYEEAAEMVKG